MQEEVENRTANLAVSTTKLSANALIRGIQCYLVHHNNQKMRKAVEGRNGPEGAQSVKELLKSGAGIESIEVADGPVRRFCHIAKKMGVDYAIRKDKTVVPQRYIVFFKAKDDAVLQQVLKEYTAQCLTKKNSVIEKLHQMAEKVKAKTELNRAKSRKKLREQSR